MRKRKKTGYQHFLILQCLQKASFSGLLKVRIVWERVNFLPRKPWFLCVLQHKSFENSVGKEEIACDTSLLKTLWEKEKLLVTSNFSFSHSVFYGFGELSAISIKFEVICKLFQFGRVSNLSFRKEITVPTKFILSNK